MTLDVFLARQPIFDRRDRLVGYELLYRNAPEVNRAEGADPDHMSSDVIVQAFLGIGIERLTGGVPGFVNCTREMLVDGTFRLLPRESVVIELLESVEADEEVVDACVRIVESGYRLALDDFVAGPGTEPLLRVAEIVKIDVLSRSSAETAELVAMMRGLGVRMLAERVETEEMRRRCEELGFDLFQGYFFARPEILANREVPVEQAGIIRLMNRLRDERATDGELAEEFRVDPSLSYRLLRIVNAAALGGRGVRSIPHAIQLVGREALHRWLSLLLVSSLSTGSDLSVELVHLAVQRARLCELLGEWRGRTEEEEPLFLVGLFSMLDALLRVPVERIVESVDLAPDVRDALLHRGGPYAPALELVEAYERGAWDRVPALAATVGVSALDLPDLYVRALQWSRERLHASE